LSSIIEQIKLNLQDKIYILESVQKLDEELIAVLGQGQTDVAIYDDYLEQSNELRIKIEELEREFSALMEQAMLEKKNGIKHDSDSLKSIGELSTKMDGLITSVSAKEKDVQKLVKKYFVTARSEIQKSRQSLKVARGYADVQNYGGAVSPQFMDDKK